MSISKQAKVLVVLAGLALAAMSPAQAWSAEAPPYESNPTLSLIGNCETIPGIDPVPDPSCTGEPPSYPPPPDRPAGRFEQPRAIAVDRYGNQYVASLAGGDDVKGRVDVFDGEGRFVTEFAARDAQTAAVDSKGNFYIFRNNGEVVLYAPTGEYKPEEGIIEYGNPPALVSNGTFVGTVAVDTDPAHLDQLLVSRPEVITRYKSATEGSAEIESYEPVGLGSWPNQMAVDSQRRRLFVSFCKKSNEECGVKVLDVDNPEEVLETFDGSTVPAGQFATLSGHLPVAVDESTGDFFIVDPASKAIYRFDEDYQFLSQQKFNELLIGVQIAVSNGTRSLAAEPCVYPEDPVPPAGDACNRHYLFVPVFNAKGRVAAFGRPNQGPPVIEEIGTAGIGETEAELAATIFPSGLDTEYSFEITTQAAWEAESEKFESATTIPGGTIPAESLARAVTVFADGLEPGQNYRFRVVVENELGTVEDESTFATYDDAPIESGCPNEALRLGSSALLPDCRAYELVTPADTNGRSPRGVGELGSLFSTLHASPAGESVSFNIVGGSLPGTSGVGGFDGDPYVATRGSSGWGSELAGPTGAEVTKSAPASVSPDQGFNFWRAREEGPLVIPGSIITEYLHYPDGHSELIGRGSLGIEPRAMGKLITEDAAHVVFQSFNLGFNKAVQLEPNAPPEGTEALYDRTIDPVTGAEETHVVSLLPGDETPAAGDEANYRGGSKDGAGIAFELGNVLYLRLNNETTYEIATGVEFAGVSEGGDRVFYLQGGDLKAFDTAAEEVIDFSESGDVTPVNVSTGGTRAYFVSASVLGGENPEGAVAQAGEQNLYLSEEGTISFVATVTDRDVEGEPAGVDDGLGLWTKVAGSQPARDPSRTNPDGSVLLFQSRANITGYPASDFPQVYRFDSTAPRLHCLSCIPTARPATGGASLESYSPSPFSTEPFSAYGFVPNLNPEGTRVFFESTEALVSSDSDKVNDVYEWEDQGVGGCERAEGCLYLISSGQSERPNFIYGQSTDGDDVFFTTGDSLTGWDGTGGAISIYDARVGGGFPEPLEQEICVADGCRPSVTPAPVFERPRAGGDGDVPRQTKPKPCSKGKHKVKKNGKTRCVKKKKGKKSKKGRVAA